MKLSILSAALLVAGVYAAPTSITNATSTTAAATTTTNTYIAQFSPVFSNVSVATGVVSQYNYGPYNLTTALSTETLQGYPTPWESPDTTHPEVQAAYKKIDWTKVPNAPVRKQTASGAWEFTSDGPKDPYCWWSSSNCVTPKIDIPQDYYTCGHKGDWGLSYDDGPFNRYTGKEAAVENKFAEPALYNFLANTNNQKANLFYIGSNVATYPEAAKRGFNDGHYICVHTWSHPAMTTVTNEQAVAELYWTLKAIKEATGVTPKCWRPPQGTALYNCSFSAKSEILNPLFFLLLQVTLMTESVLLPGKWVCTLFFGTKTVTIGICLLPVEETCLNPLSTVTSRDGSPLVKPVTIPLVTLF
jgi:hypothetical protein